MPPTEEEREASTLDVASQQIFAMLDAFPRFKDLATDPMRPADQAADVRGCILFTGPLKMLQTVAMVTQAGKASTAPERFKPLLSRCKWLAADAILGELGPDAGGTEGLLERLRAHEPSSQYVFVLAAQVASGGLCCKHHTGTGSPGVADVGPCQYVMDHGRERLALTLTLTLTLTLILTLTLNLTLTLTLILTPHPNASPGSTVCQASTTQARCVRTA